MAKTVRQALKGRSDFISDVYVRDMLYGATVRSPYSHALIRRIDTSTLPDDILCVTASDVPGTNLLAIDNERMPILASRECRYAGEPVALLAGPTQRSVIDAMALLDVEYEELPSVFAWQDGKAKPYFTIKGSRGSPYTELSASHSVVEGSYRTGIQEHLYNEPQGAVAEIEDDRIAIRTATQWPFHVRETVAANLDIRPSACVVRSSDLGISLDGKLWYPSLVATHVALLAYHSGCPVKMIYSNIEDYQFTPKRAPFLVRYVTGIGTDGTLIATKVHIACNAGAYPLFTKEIADRAVAAALGHYRCDHAEVELSVVSTNLPPLNVLSGFGMAPPQFALETHVSRLAEISHVDPIDWRSANVAVPTIAAPAVKSRRDRIERVLRASALYSDFHRKHAAYELQRKRRAEFTDLRRPTRGIGVACGCQGCGFIGGNGAAHPGSVAVRLEADGSVLLRASSVPGSQAIRDNWKNQCSTILGVQAAAVKLEAIDTDLVPDSGPSTLSRNVTLITRLIEQACTAIQRKRFRSALPIEVRRSARAEGRAVERRNALRHAIRVALAGGGDCGNGGRSCDL